MTVSFRHNVAEDIKLEMESTSTVERKTSAQQKSFQDINFPPRAQNQKDGLDIYLKTRGRRWVIRSDDTLV